MHVFLPLDTVDNGIAHYPYFYGSARVLLIGVAVVLKSCK